MAATLLMAPLRAGSLPGATVTATNTRTGVARTAFTGGDGSYSLPGLEPGTYNVVVTRGNEYAHHEQRVELAPGAEAAVDIVVVHQSVASRRRPWNKTRV